MHRFRFESSPSNAFCNIRLKKVDFHVHFSVSFPFLKKKELLHMRCTAHRFGSERWQTQRREYCRRMEEEKLFTVARQNVIVTDGGWKTFSSIKRPKNVKRTEQRSTWGSCERSEKFITTKWWRIDRCVFSSYGLVCHCRGENDWSFCKASVYFCIKFILLFTCFLSFLAFSRRFDFPIDFSVTEYGENTFSYVYTSCESIDSFCTVA